MATRDALKKEFQNGERPSGDDFAALIDSFLHKDEDGLKFDSSTTKKNLSLPGGLILGDSESKTTGTLRLNSNHIQFYDGSKWADVGSGAFQPVEGSTTNAVTYTGGNVGIGSFFRQGTAPDSDYLLDVRNQSSTVPTGSAQVRFGSLVCGNGPGRAFGAYAVLAHRDHYTQSNFGFYQDASGSVRINAPSGQQTVSITLGGTQTCLSVNADGTVVVSKDLQVQGRAFKPGGGTWEVSDVRVKEDIHDLEAGLDQLMQVRPVRFRYNGKAGTPKGQTGVGIIGQEMANIFPEMVQQVPNTEGLDGDGLLIYNDAALTYVLVNAVKELATKVKQLEADNALANSRMQYMKALAVKVKQLEIALADLREQSFNCQSLATNPPA